MPYRIQETGMTGNDEQAKIWNGPAGEAWVEAQQLLDEMFRPFEHHLVDAAAAHGAHHVLDVGCGTGSTTLAIAARIDGDATGVDVSMPMVALAKSRAGRARSSAQFVVGDAQSHVFVSGRYDLIVSRFGIMFFADPAVAFANLRRAAAPGGALHAIAFRSVAENPFMTAAERAAAPFLPDLPRRDPDAPGQFAFADAGRVRGILAAGGWRSIDIRPTDVDCAMPAAALDQYITKLGPVGLAMRSAPESSRAPVLAAVRAGFAPYLQGADVRFTAACWTITAIAG
jgi:SAM-dependent methyltransferase